jgi:hypothetical protein
VSAEEAREEAEQAAGPWLRFGWCHYPGELRGIQARHFVAPLRQRVLPRLQVGWVVFERNVDAMTERAVLLYLVERIDSMNFVLAAHTETDSIMLSGLEIVPTTIALHGEATLNAARVVLVHP